MRLLPGPLLVGAAIAGPDLDRSAVGGACPGHIETQTGLNADDGAVGVEVPLLVSATVAVPDLHAGASSGGVIGHVETLIAVDLQLTVGEVGPLLIGAAVAVPDLQQGAIGGGQIGDIQAAIGPHAAQDSRASTAASTVPVSRCDNVGLDGIICRIGGITSRHDSFEEFALAPIAVVATGSQNDGSLLVHGGITA